MIDRHIRDQKQRRDEESKETSCHYNNLLAGCGYDNQQNQRMDFLRANRSQYRSFTNGLAISDYFANATYRSCFIWHI